MDARFVPPAPRLICVGKKSSISPSGTRFRRRWASWARYGENSSFFICSKDRHLMSCLHCMSDNIDEQCKLLLDVNVQGCSKIIQRYWTIQVFWRRELLVHLRRPLLWYFEGIFIYTSYLFPMFAEAIHVKDIEQSNLQEKNQSWIMLSNLIYVWDLSSTKLSTSVP